MTHDPFAVSDYPFESLPEVRDTRRADFETAEFGPIWVEHMGGIERASRAVLNSFSLNKRYGHLEPRSLGPRKPGQAIELSLDNLDVIGHAPEPTRSEKLSQRLGLVTLLDNLQGGIPTDLHKALVIALGLERKFERRKKAEQRAWERARAETFGVSTSDSIKHSRLVVGGSNGTVWGQKESGESRSNALRETFSAILSDIEKSRPKIPHAADAWFESGQQDRIAQAITDALRARSRGNKMGELRWDLLNLIEGFVRRRLPISAPMQVALDHALGLVDQNGRARTNLALGSIVPRSLFMALAREVAKGPSTRNAQTLIADMGETYPETPDISAARRWMKSGLFHTAVEFLRR